MRRMLASVIIVMVTMLVLMAAPASARPIIGCGGIVEWPCPGPVLIDP